MTRKPMPAWKRECAMLDPRTLKPIELERPAPDAETLRQFEIETRRRSDAEVLGSGS